MSAIPNNAYILIIGAMKCGTSFLYSLLSQHPNICSCRIKEPEFFSQRQPHGVKTDNYESLWQFDSKQHAFVLEASTGYTKFPLEMNVPKRIHEHGIDPFFVYIVRDPYARIESDFNFSRTVGLVDYSLTMTNGRYVSLSNYYQQAAKYLEYFPQERFIIVDFEELARSPQLVVNRLCKKIGLSQLPVDVGNTDRNETGYKSRYSQWADRNPKTAARLPRNLKAWLPNLPYLRAEKRHRLSVAERAEVHRQLEKDMERFSRVFNFPVDRWGFDAREMKEIGSRYQ